uniref:Uncharacterized protein n=1 Tax=Anguilla anguilla TaxID=7936 RepID=A0A0E9XVW4_ANGAN
MSASQNHTFIGSSHEIRRISRS